MSEKISMIRRLRLEANGLGEFQTYASRDYRRMLLDAADEIERLRKERDEARREVCEWEHHWDKTSSEQYYADKRGWDCFKEDKPCQ
jgi:hypothetical protein